MDWKAQLWSLSPELIKAVIALLGAWLLHRLTTKNADLISYMSQVQTVNVPAQGQVPGGVVHTFTLFLWNQGKAAANSVEIGHFFLPYHNVYPDVVRNVVPTHGGGSAIQITSIPPRTQINITYLLVNLPPTTPVVSHVIYEYGPAHYIPANFQRVYPKWFQILGGILVLAGMYTFAGWVLDLLRYLVHRQ